MLLDVPSYPKELADGWPVLVLIALVVLAAAIMLIAVLRRRGRGTAFHAPPDSSAPGATGGRSPGLAPDAPQAPREAP